MSIKEDTNQLEKLVKKEVSLLLIKIERPFGVLLSGGIDSGLLAALTKPDYVFTCRFPYGKKYDEFKYSRMTAKHLGLKQIVITPTKKDFFKYLPQALKLYKPTTHFSLVPLYMIFKKAKEYVDRILSAEGPDEYLGGYTAYSFITHEQKLYQKPELKNYKSMLDKYLGSPIERYARIINQPVKSIKPYWGKYKNLLSKMGYCDLKLRGIEEMEMALAKGLKIELLYPFMAKKIEEFCFRVPDEYKIKDFTTKYIWRKITEKYLPKEVVWRKNKMGGPIAPVGKWLGEKDEFGKIKYLKLQNVINHHHRI